MARSPKEIESIEHVKSINLPVILPLEPTIERYNTRRILPSYT